MSRLGKTLILGLVLSILALGVAVAAGPPHVITATAGTSVEAGQIVKLSETSTITFTGAITDAGIGVCMTTAATNGLTSYATPGMQATITVNGTVTLGQFVMCGTGGRGNALTLSTTARIIGVALTSTATTGRLPCTIFISPQYYQPTP